MYEDDIEFDVLMDGAVIKGLLTGSRPSTDGLVGIEILA
jgi:hypothetical protein